MPHAVIEYSGNIEEHVLEADLTSIVWGALEGSGLFQAKDIKVRSHGYSDFMVGKKGQDGSFVHVSIAMMEGRSVGQKQTLSEKVLQELAPHLGEVDSLTVDIREMAKDTYRKVSA